MESTIQIPLSRGKVAIIDAADFDKVKDFSWYASERKKLYAKMDSAEGKKVYMHRVITGAKKGQIVDHINGNVLDNRRRNLRLVTNSQNCWNRRKRKSKSTDFLGVTLRRKNKFEAKFKTKADSRYLGTFDNPYEAAVCYDMEKVLIAGVYGSYNFNEICDVGRLKFLIINAAGNITVVFRKRTDGEVRKMYCRVSGKFYTSDAHRKACREKGLLLVKEIDLNEFRFILFESIIAVKIDDRFYAKQLKP